MREEEAYLGGYLLGDDPGRAGRRMRGLSAGELTDLGRRFDVAVDDVEADGIAAAVNAMLDGLERVAGVPLSGSGEDVGERTWRDPTDDPHNAVATACRVPPKPDASDGLSGLSVGLKDNVAVAGVPMQAGSAVMYGFVPGRDATVVDRLRAAGATITAKTAMDEFAGGGGGTRSATGTVTNPHDERRATGGSSSGSAAAVAAGRVDAALGTDTGGSVRIPASFCGIVGLLPTYGLVPLSGVVEQTYTQDVVGPMTSTVSDAARLLSAIAGADRSDPASLRAAGREGYRVGGYADAVENPPAAPSLRLGVLEAGFGDEVDDAVADRVRGVVDRLEDRGASVEPVAVPGLYEYGKEVKSVISYVELASHWRDGGAAYRRGGTVDERYQAAFARRRRAASGSLGDFFKAKLLAGARLIDADDGGIYTRAQAAREGLSAAFRDVFAEVDLVVAPTMPSVAPLVEDATDPGFDYALNTRIATLARLPAITLPAGTVDDLPVGVQFVVDAFREDVLLGAAATVEDLLDGARD